MKLQIAILTAVTFFVSNFAFAAPDARVKADRFCARQISVSCKQAGGCTKRQRKQSINRCKENQDPDGDNTRTKFDNCVDAANESQVDADDDGFGDDCDNAPNVANKGQEDTDGDGVGDVADNCVGQGNLTQLDSDTDGVGDECDMCPSENDLVDANDDSVFDCLVTASKLVQTEPANSVQSGAVTVFPLSIIDGTGADFDLTARGVIADGTLQTNSGLIGDAFDSGTRLFVNGVEFPAQGSASLEDVREVVFGPATMNGLNVTRKVFVPQASGRGFARWLDVLENSTAGDITVSAQVRGSVGSGDRTDFAFLTSSGDATVSGADKWWFDCIEFGKEPCLSIFTCGATMSKTLDDYVNDFGNVTVKAGKRVILLSIVTMSTTLAGESLPVVTERNRIQFAALEKFPLVDSFYLEGMTSSELNDLIACNGAYKINGVAGSVVEGSTINLTNSSLSTVAQATADTLGAWAAAIIANGGQGINFSSSDGTQGAVTTPSS